MTEKLNKAYMDGSLKASSNLHRFNEDELNERFPAIGKFGRADVLKGKDETKLAATEEVAATAFESSSFPAQGGALGNAWTRDKKTDPSLDARYRAAGKKLRTKNSSGFIG